MAENEEKWVLVWNESAYDLRHHHFGFARRCASRSREMKAAPGPLHSLRKP